MTLQLSRSRDSVLCAYIFANYVCLKPADYTKTRKWTPAATRNIASEWRRSFRGQPARSPRISFTFLLSCTVADNPQFIVNGFRKAGIPHSLEQEEEFQATEECISEEEFISDYEYDG